MLVATQQSSAKYDKQTESYNIMVSYNTTDVSPFCHTESTTTEFGSEALTNWAIRSWVQLALRANFAQLLFHLLLSVRFHFGYCLRQSSPLFNRSFVEVILQWLKLPFYITTCCGEVPRLIRCPLKTFHYMRLWVNWALRVLIKPSFILRKGILFSRHWH